MDTQQVKLVFVTEISLGRRNTKKFGFRVCVVSTLPTKPHEHEFLTREMKLSVKHGDVTQDSRSINARLKYAANFGTLYSSCIKH